MTEITEYGEIITFDTILDEYGRRRIANNLLEDGTFIIVIVVVVPIRRVFGDGLVWITLKKGNLFVGIITTPLVKYYGYPSERYCNPTS